MSTETIDPITMIDAVTAARISTHFLPKFDNENSPKASRLTSRAPKAARCLAVSKKHSGHLVMAPPFYSKNGVGNRFSRMGALLLRAHFDAVWGADKGAAKFAAWWEHAEGHELCYSFECVVPTVLGDHGATPRAAYMVLTCASHASTFLSPAQLLALGAAWRLPLNEVWFVPWERAPAIEESLHAARWTMEDADASRFLADVSSRQCFLTHGETQGDVLEGFVLMALDSSVQDLAPLLTAYEAAVAPHRRTALLTALRLGHTCAAREAALTSQLDAPSESWAHWPTELPAEPRRLPMAADAVWETACASGGPLGALFTTLRALYAHRVHLKPYTYRDALQIQIEVKDDQCFFGWPLHAALCGVAPLFRGMVVSFDGHRNADRTADRTAGDASARLCQAIDAAVAAASGPSAGTPGALAIPAARVLGIAKLKCLNYLIRTFGVRNQLPVLLRHGANEYLKRVRNFFRNWSVPEEHQPRLHSIFSNWAAEVATLPPHARDELQAGAYLHILEPFLHGEVRRGTNAAANGFGVERFCLIVCNLTGEPLPVDTLPLYAPGMLSVTRKDASETPRPGTVTVLTAPPSGKALATGNPYTLVIVFSPAHGADKQWHSKARTCDNLVQRFPTLRGRIFTRPSVAEWKAAVAKLAAELPHPSDAPPPAAELLDLPHRVIVLLLGLPPGGGKSSLFYLLQQHHRAVVVSSDAEKARNGDPRAFDAALKLELRPDRGHSRLVCYDKNVPNVEGLAKALRVLDECRRTLKVRISVVSVVPAWLDHDLAWQRVRERPPTDIALNVHAIPGGEAEAYRIFSSIFFEPAEAFLPLAQGLPAAIVSDAFWQDLGKARELASRIAGSVDRAVALADLQAVLQEGARSSNRAAGPHQWAKAEIPASKLHLTLLPPPAAAARGASGSAAEAEEERGALLKRMRAQVGVWVQVPLLRYISAVSVPTMAAAMPRRLGFWEVGDLRGLAPDLQFAPQRSIYHVTDLAALVNTSPRDCAEMLLAIRRCSEHRPENGAEWRVSALGTEWLLNEPMPPTTSGEAAAREVAAQIQIAS